MHARRLAGPALAIALATASCASGSDSTDGAEPAAEHTGAAGDEDLDEDVVVFAAASLTEAFEELGEMFEATYPGSSVTFSFAGSSTLATQIAQGAPADVFASANHEVMSSAHEAGNVTEPVDFATNSLTIAVAPGNPLGIESLADIAGADTVVVQCAVEVPCGALAESILDQAGVELTPASYEADVKAVVTKVVLGEADAGLAYETDVAATGDDVESVELPAEIDAVTAYPIATVAGSDHTTGATAFIELVRSPEGRDVLARHGFGPP